MLIMKILFIFIYLFYFYSSFKFGKDIKCTVNAILYSNEFKYRNQLFDILKQEIFLFAFSICMLFFLLLFTSSFLFF